METQTAVEIKELTKRYEDKVVVNGVSLEIKKGECFGLLGPNGAGKSTVMKMMYGSALISSGEMYVLGLNVKKNSPEIRKRIGIVPQDNGLDADFSVLDNLLVYANYHDISPSEANSRAQALLRLIKLEEHQEDSVDVLDASMQRRLAIVRGLINQPEILFLDEPTAGLDIQTRLWIWDFLRQVRDEKSTYVLTTHLMEEAEFICDRVAIMNEGDLLTVGKPKQLIAEHIGKEILEFETNPVDLNYYLGRLKASGYSYQVFKNMVQIFIKDHQDGRQAMSLVASDKIFLRKPTLNDVFLKLAGRGLKDEE